MIKPPEGLIAKEKLAKTADNKPTQPKDWAQTLPNSGGGYCGNTCKKAINMHQTVAI